MNDHNKISNKTTTIILITVSSLASLGSALISNWHNLFGYTGQPTQTTEQQKQTIKQLRGTIKEQKRAIEQQKQTIKQLRGTIKEQKQTIEQQKSRQELDKKIIEKQGVAIVFDPPSNVRNTPNGGIICSVREVGNIDLYGTPKNGWYRSDICGEMGYIHKSQIQF